MITCRSATPRYLAVAAALGVAVLTGCSSASSGGNLSQHTGSADSSETFHNISPRANHLIQRTLPLMRGVASNTYQNRDLVVRFTSSAAKVDQTNVENVVHNDIQAALAKPTSTSSKKK